MAVTYVLVHGAWGGAWIWRRILGPLRTAGHEVHAATLTGDGERAHLRRADISLQNHIDDVLGLIDAEELQGIVLVGHSYGGMVITGVADALLARGHARLARLIYIDAQVPLSGESWSSLHSAEVQQQRTATAQAHGGVLPPADPAAFGIAGGDRDWLLRRQVPHPFGPYRDPVHYDAERLAGVPRHYIACTQPAFPTALDHHARVRSWPGWQIAEIATGHCPMVSAPQALLALLISMA
jgi:pimeloyl-ACP methyl ester carboxylesterase